MRGISQEKRGSCEEGGEPGGRVEVVDCGQEKGIKNVSGKIDFNRYSLNVSLQRTISKEPQQNNLLMISYSGQMFLDYPS